jgi:hypothetical protein
MSNGKDRLRNYLSSLYLLAAAICLAPAVAGAQPPDPTASDANHNTAAGTDALLVVTGAENTGVGYQALKSNTTGSQNTASGVQALTSNTSGEFNTASGVQALLSNTTGSNNVALGAQALEANQTGKNNVAVGIGALSGLAGTANIALGFNAGKDTTSGISNIYIGHPGIAGSESKITRIGHGQAKVFIAGIAGVPASGATVVVRATGQLGVVASSARYKQDIKPLDEMASRLTQLRPVSYRYKAEPQATHYGLIAEEVAAAMPELVVRDGQNRPESVQYLELIPLLLQQWKAQQAAIASQHELIARQQARLERDETELAALRRTLAVASH